MLGSFFRGFSNHWKLGSAAMKKHEKKSPPPPPVVADEGLNFTLPVNFHVKGRS